MVDVADDELVSLFLPFCAIAFALSIYFSLKSSVSLVGRRGLAVGVLVLGIISPPKKRFVCVCAVGDEHSAC